MIFRLIYQTDHEGDNYIHATISEQELRQSVIWAQAIWSGRGTFDRTKKRVMNITYSDFEAASTTEGKTWYLYFVSETPGRGHHVFLKFFLSQKQRHDYDLETTIKDGNVLQHLSEYFEFSQYKSFMHVNIGLDIQTLQPQEAQSWQYEQEDSFEEMEVRGMMEVEAMEDYKRHGFDNECIRQAIEQDLL